jgi:hypothetical protein
MDSTDVVDAFTTTKQTLHESGITDDFFLDLVASRLLVERIGESDNQDWWESRVLSETGRARLSEVTPKTLLKSQIDLAMKVGRKAESDRLPEDAISFFSFGPQVESRLTAALDQIQADEDFKIESLEELSIQSLDKGWTDSVIDQTESNISSESLSDPFPEAEPDGSILIDDTGYTQDAIGQEKWSLLVTFLRGYGQCTDELIVPYYPLEAEIKSENA